MNKTSCLAVLSISFIVYLLPSARVFYKYANAYQPMAYILYAVVLLALIFIALSKEHSAVARNTVCDRRVVVFLFLATVVFVWFVYPLADGLKSQMRGSDQDDCVIICATRLANLVNPYVERSYYNNPCSTGMGMLIVYLPFVLLGLYQFGAVLLCFFAYLSVKNYTRNPYVSVVYLIFMCLSLFFAELLAVGSDLIFVGCSILILAIGLVVALERKSIGFLLLLAILAGLVSSTRVNFLVVICVLSVFVFVRWRWVAWYFLFGGYSCCDSAFSYCLFAKPC